LKFKQLKQSYKIKLKTALWQ